MVTQIEVFVTNKLGDNKSYIYNIYPTTHEQALEKAYKYIDLYEDLTINEIVLR